MQARTLSARGRRGVRRVAQEKVNGFRVYQKTR
jgi:hypothetical protein